MAQDWFDQATTPVQQPAQRRGVIVSDPYRPRDEDRKDQALDLDAARLGVAQQAEERQRATLPADIRKTEADARLSELRAEAAEKEQANAPRPEMAKIQQAIKTSALLDAVNSARRQIGGGYATGNFFGKTGWQSVPMLGQNSTNLAATISGIQGSIINDTLAQLKAQSANGASGYGSLTESEAQRLAAAVGALQQSQDADSLLANLARVERHYRNALALSYGEDPREDAVQEKYGIVPEMAGSSASGQRQLAPGENVTDPGLTGVNAKVASMIRGGRTEQEIRDYLDAVRPGLGRAQNLPEAIQFARQNPQLPPQVNLESFWEPATGVPSAIGEIGMSPFGSAVVGAADTLSMGALDNLTSNPDMARAVMGGLSQENPTSYLLGQLGGGLASGLGVEAGLGRAGLSSLGRARAGDLALGAAYGAGAADEPDGNRVAAALLGGGAGLAGGAAGRGLTRAGGRLVAGIDDPSRRALNAADVRMTPGQILGGAAQRTEDRLAGLSVVGDQIRARRVEGIEDFNRAAFDEALAPINQTTGGVVREHGIDVARALRSNAYDDALSGVNVTADPIFTADMRQVIDAGTALPEPMRGNMVDYTLPTRVGQSFDNAGNLSGRDYQQALRGLRRDAASMDAQPYGWDFGNVANQAEAALEGLVDRQAPGVADGLRTANEVNRRVETLRSAVNAARNGTTSGEVGIFFPSQLSTAAAQSSRRYGNSQGTTRQPFYELTRAGQDVLPSRVPDSGTAGRLVLPALAAGAIGGGSYATNEGENAGSSSLASGAIAAALAMAPYSPPARAAIQKLLLADRPQVLERAGREIMDRDYIAGILARSAAVPDVTGP